MARGDAASALEQLPGVLAATILADSTRIPLVYLAASPETDPETLRAAAAMALEIFGTPTPLDRIHVASPAPQRTARSRSALPRFAFDGFEVHRSEGRATCSVRLRADRRLVEGSATEPDTPSGCARAAARATLIAAEGFDPDLRFGLDGLRVIDLFGHRALVLLVDANAGRSRVHLPGVVMLDRSLEEAAAHAVIHALRTWAV